MTGVFCHAANAKLMRKLFIPLLLIVAGIVLWSISSHAGRSYSDADVESDAETKVSIGSEAAAPVELVDDNADSSIYENHLPAMPDDGIVKLHINPIGGSLGRVFNDSNYIHLQAATALGIDPVRDDRSAWNLRRPLVEIKSCREYFVDTLTHSYPFLVPEAAALLKEIGEKFNHELEARGGGSYRMKVTSVLRTPLTVGKLKRINRNATEESAHQYGTTFDISHAKFICDSITVARSQEDLKNLLAEVIDSLRKEGRLYVKHERKQACFHITVRK